jgi:hypothetical protein
MFQRDGILYELHHVGLPTNEMRPNERYNAQFGMYTSESDCRFVRVQWHRFNSDSPLHPLIRSTPHVAFKVNDLTRAVAGCRILLEPYEPIKGYRVAIIEDGGVPIELVQTTLSDEEIWSRAKAASRTQR